MTARHPTGNGLRVAVTGAGGFIGGRLAALLALQPGVAEVRVLVRRRGPGQAAAVLARLDNPAQVQAALQGCDAVVHCAFDYYDLPANLVIAQVLAEAAILTGARLVHLSSAVVHEPLPDGALDEGAPAAPDGDAYKDTKIAIEERLLASARDHGLDLVVLQPTIVYGPRGGAWTDSPVRELLTGEVLLPAQGEGLCNAVFVDDVCQAAIAALTAHIAPGERFLVSGAAPVTWREFLGAYERMLGTRSLRLSDLPPPAGHPGSGKGPALRMGAAGALRRLIAVRLGAAGRSRLSLLLQRARKAVRGRRAYLPNGAKHALYAARCHVRIDKARRSLGYEPQFDLDRGMEATERYVRQAYAGIARAAGPQHGDAQDPVLPHGAPSADQAG
jgi:nucleoside-diphosphate-sugar epimerase